MENMDKGLTVPKRVLINRPKISQMPQNLSAQIVCSSPKVWDFDEKKGFIGRPWYLHTTNYIMFSAIYKFYDITLLLTYLLTKYLRKEESQVCTYVLKWPPFNLSRSIHAKNSKPFPSAILALWDLFDPVLPRMHLWDWINKAIDYHSTVPQWGQSFMMTNLFICIRLNNKLLDYLSNIT